MPPIRFSMKLKEGAAPHMYVIQLKKIMEEDKELHPMMARTLKMLKKTRTPFIMLSMKREIVIDGDNFRHFERSAEPQAGAWIITYWSDDEIKQHKEDAEGHLKAFMKMMESLGYEFFNSNVCSIDYIKTLESLCSKQIESQLQGREKYYGH
jgi:hypothetical protein